RHAVLHEGALTLEDYWVRRSARAWFDADGGLGALAPAAEAMAGLLGWSDSRERSYSIGGYRHQFLGCLDISGQKECRIAT
ncbi:MAG: glycerol-3-phosphate dehydrogenase C-terminal domain-containing protein, partial [Actinomycetes bacterium]